MKYINNKNKMNKFLMKFRNNSKIIIHNNYHYFNRILIYKYHNYTNRYNRYNKNIKNKNYYIIIKMNFNKRIIHINIKWNNKQSKYNN